MVTSKCQVALYVRISEDRLGTELGITRQRDDARRYANDQGWSVVSEFSDNDLSATRGTPRPGYGDLMRAAEAGDFAWIVVWHQSRLWRNRRERADGIERLKAARVSLAAVKGPDLDLTTAQGRMLAGLLGEVDTAEVEIKSERQVAAALQAAQRGQPTGGPRPFGYEAGGVAPHPVEAQAVQDAFEALLTGTPLREIARQLNRQGIVTSLGKQWGATQVRAMMLRARNAGLRAYRGEVIGPAVWPPLVDEATWRAATTIITDPGRRTSPGFATRWLLSGLARCGVCGATVSSAGTARIRSDGSRRIVYRCRTRKHVARDASPTNDLVSRVVVTRLTQSDAQELLVKNDVPRAKELRAECLVLRSRLESVACEYADGALTAAQLRVATERLSRRLADVEAALPDTRGTPTITDLVLAADVQGAWDNLSFDRKRAVIRTLLEVTILPETTRGARNFRPELVRMTWKTT